LRRYFPDLPQIKFAGTEQRRRCHAEKLVGTLAAAYAEAGRFDAPMKCAWNFCRFNF
jgi:hypothetical protein